MVIKIADKIVKVNNLFSYIEKYCKDYIYSGDDPFDMEISIYMDDILYERKKSAETDKFEGREVINYSDEYLETLAVYRKLAEELLKYDVLLFHGSVVAVDGQAYIFTAKSGTGKSTHVSYWREYFKDRAVMVNDDKPLIAVSNNNAIVYGTPWDGKHRISNNLSFPVKAICVLTRSEDNYIEVINDKYSYYSLILQQTYRPNDTGLMSNTLNLIDNLISSVDLYKLGCNMSIEAAKVAYEGMKG